MIKKILLGLGGIGAAALFLAPLSAQAEFSPAAWPFRQPLPVPAEGLPSYVRVPLNQQTAAANADWRDVRVADAAGREIPFQLITERAGEGESYYSSKIVNSVKDAAGNSVFVLDLGASGTLHNSLELETETPNFKRIASVYAADSLLPLDSPAWKKAASDYIFRFTDRDVSFAAGKLNVNYPDNTSRFIKVVIAGGAEGPVAVRNARVYRHIVSQAKESSVSVAIASTTDNAKEKSTELVIDRGVMGVPAHRILLSTGEENFNRRAVVQASADGSAWRAVGQGYLFRVALPKFSGANLAIDFPEVTDRFLRVIVFNQDDRPLGFDRSAKVFSIARNIVFQAEPGVSYYLYYGNAAAVRPSYDLAKFFSYIDLETVGEIKPGAGENNPAYVPPVPPKKTFTEKYPYAVDVFLVLAVLVLAAAIFLYVRSYKKETASEAGPDSLPGPDLMPPQI